MDNMKDILATVAREHGTPCFVYFMDRIYGQVEALRKAFGGLVGVSYAMKCNPHPAILARMKDRVDTLDISSGGELVKGRQAGWPGERISFTGPGKKLDELKAAYDYGVEVILESMREATILNDMAGKAGKPFRVMARVAPNKVPRGFGSHMAGKPCQFGFDEEDFDRDLPKILAMPNLKLHGLHIYSGTQCLKPDSIAENYANFIELFRRFCGGHDITPKKLILGSGIGVPYYEGDQPVNLAEVAEKIVPVFKEFKKEARFAAAQMLLETGRFLVGESGVYVVRVISSKTSRGAQMRVCDGGMNHHLAACGLLGMVVPKNYRMLKISSDRPDGPEQPYNLFGPLCTSIDTLGRSVKFPGLDEGDVVGVLSSGAYGLTSSPTGFISHGFPKEILVETRNGKPTIEDITTNATPAR